MKLSILLIDLLLFLSIFVPYYLFIRVGKQSFRKEMAQFRKIARSHNLLPNVQEHWNNNFIGIDSVENSLIFVELNSDVPEVKVIQLDTVKDCNLIKNYKTTKKGKQKIEILASLALELVFQSSGKPAVVLTFYDFNAMTGENYEVARGEKWVNLIREHLQPKKPSRLVA